MTPGRTPVRASVAILGARRLLGQHLLQRLRRHPFLEVAALADLEASGGQAYGDAVTWLHPEPLPDALAALPHRACDDDLPGDIVISLLPDGQAAATERALAEQGRLVVTHAEDLRLADDVPLILPEMNGADVSTARRRLLATPNCTTVLLCLPLLALHRSFGVEAVTVTALQAVSGADLPGLPWFAIHDRLITSLSGEERALAAETGRLFGQAFPVSAQALRVPVTRGHALAVSVALRRKATPEEARDALEAFHGDWPEGCTEAPRRPITVVTRPPDGLSGSFDQAGGDRIWVSALAPCPVADLRFVISGDNLSRGVVTTALGVAELLVLTDSSA